MVKRLSTRTINSTVQRLALPLALASALAACSTMEVHNDTLKKTEEARVAPEVPPFKSITGFSHALRCMDNLMVDYGVRDISMLVEEIADQTKKIDAGTRDMLISAVSDMTRRSRALRVVAFGKDATNAISFLASAQRQSAYEIIPQYDIKGSVSQFDENVIRNQKDFGIGYSPFLNIGAAKDLASSILGLDLSVLTTDDMSVLAGVTSRNSVVILKGGKGVAADAAYSKFGINYSMTLSKSEGKSQALRGLVELAVVELVGKLTKTPYWTCLGADRNNEEIKQEVADWYFAMSGSGVEIVAYFQNQLRRRGFYDGPIDGNFNPAMDEAVSNYPGELGLSREAIIDEAFFSAFLAADHSKVQRPAKPASMAAAAPAPAPAPAPAAPIDPAKPLALSLSTPNKQTRFTPGEAFSLMVQPTSDAHVYCYLQDETARITRFYPNRFAKDSLVSASRPLALPGAMRFQLSMNTHGREETIACFATHRDVTAELPNTIVGVDFEPLSGVSFSQIRSAFARAAGGSMAEETFHVQAR